MPAKYQVYKDMSGKFRFRLRAENNKIVAVSEAYERKAGAMKGVKSVQSNCQSEIEDTTIQSEKIANPKYQIFADIASKYRFNLSASNGEIIATSEGYETKQGCTNGIKAVKNSCSSEIEDLTVDQVIEEPEMVEESGSVTTKLVFDPPKSTKKGSIVKLQGKLMRADSEKGISYAKIQIMDADRSFMKDDIVTFAETNSDGFFSVNWIAKHMDWLDNTVEMYAVFKGKDIFKPTCSKKSVLTVI
jgi:uncharacterized protein YegP (UPF0339 family)